MLLLACYILFGVIVGGYGLWFLLVVVQGTVFYNWVWFLVIPTSLFYWGMWLLIVTGSFGYHTSGI